jgi:hypothetical protein
MLEFAAMEWLRELTAILASAAAVGAAVGVAAKMVFDHWLKRRAKEHDIELKAQSDAFLAAFTRVLDTDATARIEAYKTRLLEDSAARTEALKSQLAQDSAARIEALKSQLAEDSAARTETLRSHLATEASRQIELLKSELQKGVGVQLELAKQRQPAYQRLWEMMEVVSLSRETPITKELREQFDADLTSYYYRCGHALFLSLQATRLLLEAKNLLRADATDEQIRNAFSALRTTMKSDLAVYHPGEESIQIGI